MANNIFILEDQDSFIDESGRTSLEPEGAGHPSGWSAGQPAPRQPDRSEGNMDETGNMGRESEPAEGDGQGAPS